MKIDITKANALYEEYKVLTNSIFALKKQIQEAFDSDKVFCINLKKKESYEAPNALHHTMVLRLDGLAKTLREAINDCETFKEELKGVDAALLLTYILELKQRRLKVLETELNEMGIEC